jgi:arylsulfatase A-like enzyme
VRFIQLFTPRLGPARRPARHHPRKQCRDVDQPSAALIKDLKQRGLLDDTLVVWGGEFGRTAYSQGALTATTTAATTTRAASPCGWPAAA